MEIPKFGKRYVRQSIYMELEKAVESWRKDLSMVKYKRFEPGQDDYTYIQRIWECGGSITAYENKVMIKVKDNDTQDGRMKNKCGGTVL